jgi:hypothetical protein
MFKSVAMTLALAGLVAATPAAEAALIQFTVPLTGAQEAPGPGDPDGSGTATLWFRAATNEVTWSILIADVALPVAAAHIHQAPAGVAGPVRVDFVGQLTGGPLVNANVAAILADPTGWYVNVHNAEYPAGAIRGQLPVDFAVVDEPGTLALAVLGLLALAFAAFRRRG